MKKVLVVSDLHVGSIFSIMPDEVNIEQKDNPRSNRVESNALQKILFKEWKRMIADVGRVDACFMLGDACDGSNQKSRGFELWTTNIHQQVSTAADLLAMVNTNRFYGVQGSFYHVGENTSSDLAVMEELRKHCTCEFGSDLVVSIEGKRIHLCHELPYSSSPISKATSSQREITNAIMNERIYGTFDLIMRGHTHEFRMLKDNNGFVVNCPGWELRNAYKAKKGLGGVPQVGYVLLTLEEDKPIIVQDFLKSTVREHYFKEVKV
jgi:predicted phosphodiesterase